MTGERPWLTVRRGAAPLLVSLPHTGTDIPPDLEPRFASAWLARKDADWWIDRLYDFAVELDATIVHTALSRSVVDVNRDPSGVSLYPGQATTELCPTTTFDGEALYRPGEAPDAAEVAARRRLYFEPYHEALAAEITRLRGAHERIVLYDCHSIRSVIPRLFEGMLPIFNIGTNGGASCDVALTAAIERLCDASGQPRVTNGRFKGGFITRSHGNPAGGVHAAQMELACRGYMAEALGPVFEGAWPTPYDEAFAAPMRGTLRGVLGRALEFAASDGHRRTFSGLLTHYTNPRSPMSLHYAVILGSVRQDRMGIRAARWVMSALAARGHAATLVDPMETKLPLLDRMYKEFPKGGAPEAMEKLATLYRSVDGFLVVSGEYNHGIPPALKNLLDHFLEEYFWRPSGIVCYSAGGFGGVRAAMQLRMTLAELGMSSVPSLLPIPRIGAALGEDGKATEERLDASMARFSNEFDFYARALKREKEASGLPR